WDFWDYLGGDVSGARLGIFGMGRIGRAVARRAAAFGMRIQYNSRTRLPSEEERALGVEWVDWDALLTTSDVLSLHAPASPETRHVLNRESLRRMKPGSYLINTARGTLIDEEALVEVLRDGPLAGAGLEVYEREPTVHPGLLTLPNVPRLAAPHGSDGDSVGSPHFLLPRCRRRTDVGREFPRGHRSRSLALPVVWCGRFVAVVGWSEPVWRCLAACPSSGETGRPSGSWG